MKFRLRARALCDWSEVERAECDIDPALWKSILEDSKLVKDRGAHSITYFWYPRWWSLAVDGEEVRVECSELVVTDSYFYFTAYLKYSDPPVSVETDPVYLRDFEFVEDGEYVCHELQELIDEETPE